MIKKYVDKHKVESRSQKITGWVLVSSHPQLLAEWHRVLVLVAGGQHVDLQRPAHVVHLAYREGIQPRTVAPHILSWYVLKYSQIWCVWLITLSVSVPCSAWWWVRAGVPPLSASPPPQCSASCYAWGSPRPPACHTPPRDSDLRSPGVNRFR